jgi:hypothetical protein
VWPFTPILEIHWLAQIRQSTDGVGVITIEISVLIFDKMQELEEVNGVNGISQ